MIMFGAICRRAQGIRSGMKASSEVWFAGVVFVGVPLRVVAGRLDPLPKYPQILIDVTDAAAIGEPGHVLAVVLQQQSAVLVPVLPEEVLALPGVAPPPRHLILFLL